MCAIETNFYRKYGMSDETWKSLGKDLQELCKKEPRTVNSIMNLIENGTSVTTIAEALANQKADSNAARRGTEVEKTNVSKLDDLKPKVNIQELENKDTKKIATEQWEDYFKARYNENPSEARYDIARVLYRKDVAQVQAGLENMLKDSKQSKVIKAKYLAEGFATAKEKADYEKAKKDLTEHYRNNPAEAIRDYNGLFRVEGYKDPVDQGGHLTHEQFDALIRMKGLDSLELETSRVEDMAVKAVVDSRFNKGLTKANEYMAQVEQLKADGMTPESRKIMQDAIEQDSKYDAQSKKLMREAETEESKKLFKELAARNKEAEAEIAKQRRLGNNEKAAELERAMIKDKAESQKAIEAAMNQDKLKEANEVETKRYKARLAAETAVYDALDPKTKSKIAELEQKAKDAVKDANKDSNKDYEKKMPEIARAMAEAQVDKQIAEARVKRTTVHFEAGKETDDGTSRDVYLDEEMQEFVKANPEIFCDEVDEKDSNFSGTKRDEDGNKVPVHYKFSSDKFKEFMVRLSNDNQLDNEVANDAYDRADYYAEIKERKEFNDKKNASYATLAKLKDRKFAGKMYKASGVDIEKDRTVAKRWGNLGKSVGMGAIGGGATAGAVTALGEYLSTTKVVESPFYKLVEYSGSIPYKQIVHVEGKTTGNLQKTIHVEGDQAYHTQVGVDGVATGDVTLGYSGQVDYSGKGVVNGTATGQVTLGYSGYQDYTDNFTVTGTATGQATLGYSGNTGYSGTAIGDYSGTANGTIPVSHTHTDYKNGIPMGSQTWTENVDVSIPYSGKVSIPYEGTTTYSGTTTGEVSLGYSQDVTRKGTVQYSGTTTGEASIDYSQEYTYQGKADYSGTTTGQASIPYHQVVDVDGTVHWVADVDIDEPVTLDYATDVEVTGEAEYKGQKEINETVKGKPKFSWDNVKDAAIKGAIAGAIGGGVKGAADWNHIYDEGGREESVLRRALSEKGIDRKPKQEPTKPPVTTPVDNGETPTTPATQTTPPADKNPDKFSSDVSMDEVKEIQPIKFDLGVENTGRTIEKNGKTYKVMKAHLWNSIYAAYGISNMSAADKLKFRNAFRKEILGGKTFFSGDAQSLKPQITLSAFPNRTFEFSKAAFDAAPKEEYYTAASNVTSGRVNHGAQKGDPTWSGKAVCNLGSGQTKTYTTSGKANEEAAKNDLKDQIDKDPDLTPAQKERAKASIECGCELTSEE